MRAIRRLFVRSRPRFWLYLAGPALVGLASGAPSVDALTAPVAIALVAYFLVPANVFLYGVNDIFDAAADADNPRKHERERRYRGDRSTVLATVGSAGLGIGMLAVVPAAAAGWIAGFLALGAAYSAPPLRFKERPPLDSLSNGLYVLPGVAAYTAVSGQVPPLSALLGGWAWTMAMHSFSAIPDIQPDRRAGITTLATVLGERRTLAYCGVCWVFAAGAFAWLDPRAGALLLIYPILVAWIAGRHVAIDRAYWWFPAINTGVGTLLTLGGLWGLVHG